MWAAIWKYSKILTENCAGNVYVFQLPSSPTIGDVVGQVKASDLDQGENGLIRYSIKNATEDLPVALDPETGELRLTQRLAVKQK